MKNAMIYLLVTIPFFGSCQKKYSSPPFNDYEAKIRKLPQETQRIIIPKEWRKMDSLSFLRFKDATHIMIDADSIPGWITNFNKTETIYSQFGKIKSLPTNVSDLVRLKKLVFFSHQIKTVPKSLCDLRNIEYFSFWSNKISQIPNCIFKMKKVKILNLSDNLITSIPDDVINLSSVVEILLEGNKIEELPENIYRLPKLKRISLGGNPLKDPEEIRKKFEERGVKVDLN